MSWIWKIGNCFCGCAAENVRDEAPLVARNVRSHSQPVMVRQLERKKVLLRSENDYNYQMDSTSISCSGYQTFGCGSSYSGDDSDDEGSVDLKRPFKSKLNPLQEEGPSNSDEIDQDEEDSQAEVSLSLNYSEDQKKLSVYIINCRNLGYANAKKNTSNPYVQVYLLPDPAKKNRRKTGARLQTINPDFDELLPSFDLAPQDVEKHQLRVCVFHSTDTSRETSVLRRVQLQFQEKICLGEIFIPLTLYLLRRPQTRTFPLSAPKLNPFLFMSEKTKDNLGSLVLSLKFIPRDDQDPYGMKAIKRSSKTDLTKVGQRALNPRALGTLEIRIIGADGLPLRDSQKPPKPYCKIFLFGNQQTSLGLSNGLKQTTSIENSTCNPQWNHPVTYHNLTLEILRDCCLEISVWDDFKRTKNEFIGGIRLSLINSASFESMNGQQSISMSLDTRGQHDHIFDSMEVESRIWDELVHGLRSKVVQGKIPLRNFTPYDKIRLNFGAGLAGSLIKSASLLDIAC